MHSRFWIPWLVHRLFGQQSSFKVAALLLSTAASSMHDFDRLSELSHLATGLSSDRSTINLGERAFNLAASARLASRADRPCCNVQPAFISGIRPRQLRTAAAVSDRHGQIPAVVAAENGRLLGRVKTRRDALDIQREISICEFRAPRARLPSREGISPVADSDIRALLSFLWTSADCVGTCKCRFQC